MGINNNFIDQPAQVRREDTLDTGILAAFAKAHIPGLEGDASIRQFRGGASNLTYQISFGEKDFILRCAPLGAKAKSAHDMDREFRVLTQLRPFFPWVPQPLAFCKDENLIGRPFYLMEKKKGIILRANLPAGLQMSREDTRALCLNALDRMIALHAIDIKQAGLDHFGRGEGYVGRQIEGWCDRFEKSKTWNVPAFGGVMAWLRENIPDRTYPSFIHNDYRFDNLVLDPADPRQIIGVLDWEMATVGDRLMDLGNTLAYWVEAGDDPIFHFFRKQPTHLPGMLTRSEVVRYYCEKTGINPGSFWFYEVYGLFRLAVIVQQIYFRYYHGHTTNRAFRHFWFLSHYLHYRCKRRMNRP